MPNLNTRPRYYELCATYGMMIGVRVVHSTAIYSDYVWRSYAVGEDKGPGQVHRFIGRAYESALARSGFVIVRGRMVPNGYPGRRPYNVRRIK